MGPMETADDPADDGPDPAGMRERERATKEGTPISVSGGAVQRG